MTTATYDRGLGMTPGENADEKRPVGRPPRQSQEPIGPAKLYREDLVRLADLVRWRKHRLGLRDYAVADAFKDLFRPSLVAEREAENARQTGAAPAGGVPVAPHLTPVTPGGFKLPFVSDVAAGAPVQSFAAPGEMFDFFQVFGGEGRYVFRAKGNSMTEAGIRSGDIVVVRRLPVAEVGEDVVASIGGELTLKRVKSRTDEEVVLVSCDGKKATYRFDPAEESNRIIGVLLGHVGVYKHRKPGRRS